MTMMTRRKALLGALGGVALVGLSACATTKVGHDTTFTIDVARVTNYIEAGVNAARTLSGLVVLVPAMAVYKASFDIAVNLLEKSAQDLAAATNGKLVITYNDTNAMTIVNSAYDAFVQLVDLVKQVMPQLATAVVSITSSKLNNAEMIFNSLQTLMSIFKLMIAPSTASMSNSHQYLETQALRTLNA